MKLTTLEPERIRLNLPGQMSVWISIGTARDLLDELQKLFSDRVKEGKGLL